MPRMVDRDTVHQTRAEPDRLDMGFKSGLFLGTGEDGSQPYDDLA